MNWNEILNNILGNAINGLISGVFTVIGVLLTIKNQNKKEKRQEEKEIYKNKAELTVTKGNFINENECDIQLLVAVFKVDENINFSYSEKYKNKNEYVYKDYIIKNVGKTSIEELEIVTTNKKCVSIFNIKDAEFCMENGMIHYGSIWDKKIFPNQELKIRLYCHKEMVVTSLLSSAFIIQYNDSNGLYWEQPFFENEYKVYSPRKVSYKEYRENISTDIAMECFEKPWLW